MTNTPQKNPHAETIMEWARLVASGEVAAGWWAIEFKSTIAYFGVLTSNPSWDAHKEFKIIKTDKHPDNQSLRNLGNEAAAAADEIASLRDTLTAVSDALAREDAQAMLEAQRDQLLGKL